MKNRYGFPRLFRTGSVFGFLFVIALPAFAPSFNNVLAQAVPQQVRLETPPGWTVFRGQSGLIVPHPAGWNVQERGDGGFVLFRPNPEGKATAVVYVQPIFKIEGRAAGVVQGLGQIAPDLFSNVQVAKVRVVSDKPEVAVGELSFTPRETRFIGAAMCFKEDLQGVLYAIASTEAVWPQGEAVMKQILGRFFYSGTGGGQALGGEGTPLMVTWRDPVEGAFTCPVPQGWKVEGGMRRFSVGDVRPEILATNQDNTILVRIGDAALPIQMSLPTQTMAQLGFYEGGFEKDEFGTQRLILRYLPSTTYLTQIYLPQRIGQVSNVQVENWPQMTEQAYGLTNYVDAGSLTFDVQTETGLRKGGAFIRTILTPFPAVGGGQWYVDKFFGYLAAPQTESTARATLIHMFQGYKIDSNWNARQVQSLTQVHGSVMAAQRQTFDIINQTYANRSAPAGAGGRAKLIY